MTLKDVAGRQACATLNTDGAAGNGARWSTSALWLAAVPFRLTEPCLGEKDAAECSRPPSLGDATTRRRLRRRPDAGFDDWPPAFIVPVQSMGVRVRLQLPGFLRNCLPREDTVLVRLRLDHLPISVHQRCESGRDVSPFKGVSPCATTSPWARCSALLSRRGCSTWSCSATASRSSSSPSSRYSKNQEPAWTARGGDLALSVLISCCPRRCCRCHVHCALVPMSSKNP